MASLLEGFIDSAQHRAHRTALVLDGRHYSYAQVAASAGRIASAVAEAPISRRSPVGLLARDSTVAYTGVVGVLAAGRGVVPIDPEASPPRIIEEIQRIGVQTLVVGADALDRLEPIAEQTSRPLTIIAPQPAELRGIAQRHPRHRYHAGDELPDARIPACPQTGPEATAWVVSTSGTTGLGRRVEVTTAAAHRGILSVERRFPTRPADCCFQRFAPTTMQFLQRLLAAWSNGATVVGWASARQTTPAALLRRHRITHLTCPPRTAAAMHHCGDLLPGRLDCLRVVLLSGGRVSVKLAQALQRAAPDAAIVAEYGHPETGGAVSAHRFDPGAGSVYGGRRFLPVGRPFEPHRLRVVDAHRQPVAPGRRGQLVVESRFARFHAAARNNREDGCFRFHTGECVEPDEAGRLWRCGRVDDRVELAGHRFDLGEIDRVLQHACGHRRVAAIRWPPSCHPIGRLVAVIGDDDPPDTHRVLARCRRHLPEPAVPDRLVAITDLPVDDRGGVDRQATLELLEQREVST